MGKITEEVKDGNFWFLTTRNKATKNVSTRIFLTGDVKVAHDWIESAKQQQLGEVFVTLTDLDRVEKFLAGEVTPKFQVNLNAIAQKKLYVDAKTIYTKAMEVLKENEGTEEKMLHVQYDNPNPVEDKPKAEKPASEPKPKPKRTSKKAKAEKPVSTARKTIVDILMTRDGLTEEDANAQYDAFIEAAGPVLTEGGDLEGMFMSDFGLEPDYLLDIMDDLVASVSM